MNQAPRNLYLRRRQRFGRKVPQETWNEYNRLIRLYEEQNPEAGPREITLARRQIAADLGI